MRANFRFYENNLLWPDKRKSFTLLGLAGAPENRLNYIYYLTFGETSISTITP